MAISDAQYLDWLQTPNEKRCILVEFSYLESGVLKTGYISNFAYTSFPTDSPANTAYDDVVTGEIYYRRNVSEVFNGGASVSIGDIGILITPDTENLISCWFNLQPINIFFGSPNWEKVDFRKIVSGIAKNMQISSDKIVLSFRDSSELLNTPFKRTKISGGVSDGKNIPLCFGQCFNVSPLLVDSATQKYQVHDGAISDITDVRDNGVSVAFTKSLSTGTFTLSAAPAGQITADVKGAAPATGNVTGYKSKAVDIVKLIIGNYTTFTFTDIDNTTFNSLNTAAPYDCGLYIQNDQYNMIEAVNGILASIGAYWYVDRVGKFKVGRITTPASGQNTLMPDDIELYGMEVKNIIPAQTSVRLGYKKNWTVQTSGLASSVTSSNKSLYGTPYSISQAEDLTILTSYPDAKAGIDTETYLVNKADSDAEAARLLLLFKNVRTVYEIKCLTAAFTFNIGDSTDVYYNKFGFSAGRALTITSVSEQLGFGSSILEAWR